jgi:AcrR family transcriptional regulator
MGDSINIAVEEFGVASIRKQKRALVTRHQLIQAARVIFVRDGFEHARVEDIAAAAGKTRGAFYANFEDKEDVFFAIFEEDIANDREVIRPLLHGFQTAEDCVNAFADHLTRLSKNRERTLLYLEFKVYAVRHPHKRKRLADLHSAMRLRCSFPELNDLLPDLNHQSAPGKRASTLAIGAIMDGLALNRLFDPGALDDEQIALYLRLCLEEAFCIRAK